jgi:parvulin-like peptidyl-prolyl isomerase
MEANQIMKRLLVVSMLSLALAGCAQSKGALSRGASYPPSPVAIAPVPSIYDTINQGTGGKALAQTAINNPEDPQWAGRTQVSQAARPVSPGSPGSAMTPVPASAAGPAAASATAVAAGPMQSPGQVVGGMPAPAAPAALTALPGIPNQTSPSMASAEPLPTPTAAGMPAPAAVADPRTVASGPMLNDPASIPASSSSPDMNSTAALPAEVAVSSPASPMPATPRPAAAAPRRNADPLLGPEPDLMPAMPDLPPVKTTAKQSPPPAGPPALAPPAQAPVPADGPLPGPAPAEPPASEPAATGTLVPAEPPINLEHSTAASKPADGGLAAVGVLPLEPAPSPGQVSPANRERAPAPAPAPAGGPNDPHVILTSTEGSRTPAAPRTRTASLKQAGRAVARVGDEVITEHELRAALIEEVDKHPQLHQGSMDGAAQLERTQAMNFLVRQAMVNLVDRSVLVQEAKRHIKDKKMLDLIYQEADKEFHDDEVLPLQRRLSVDSEAKVKEKLAERGRSLDAMRRSHRQVFLARSYMYQKLKDRIKVELPDMLRYYNEHLYNHEFDRPAQITWRELVVEVDRHKSREEARNKANALLEKVRRGADFTVLARNESEGPSSSRNEGGLMRTTPGSYAFKPINDALEALPIGQLSPLIEGPDSFHIVKVENRRPAGPASFEDVQDKIRPMLQTQRMSQESEAFIRKLKENTLIEDYLDKQDPKKS